MQNKSAVALSEGIRNTAPLTSQDVAFSSVAQRVIFGFMSGSLMVSTQLNKVVV